MVSFSMQTVHDSLHIADSVGATTWEKSMKCLKPLGMLALFGNTTGPVPPIVRSNRKLRNSIGSVSFRVLARAQDPLLLSRQGSIFLTRPTMGHYILTTEALRSRAADVFDWVASGKVR